MTPPNYFRFVRVDEAGGGVAYDGYSLQRDESFETSTWTNTGYTSAASIDYSVSNLKRDESFESGYPTGDWWS